LRKGHVEVVHSVSIQGRDEVRGERDVLVVRDVRGMRGMRGMRGVLQSDGVYKYVNENL
jgi:hypothetical protein